MTTRPAVIMSQPEDIATNDSQTDQPESQTLADETPAENVFIPPSVDKVRQLLGESYSHVSPIPPSLAADMGTEYVLGVDEAGRGPVLGECNHGRGSSVRTLIRCRTHGLRVVLSTTVYASLTACRHTSFR